MDDYLKVFHAKRTAEANLHGTDPGPHAGGGNYLAALGLLCYTEYLGAFKIARRGTDKDGRPRRGQAEKNFVAFLMTMGQPYRDFEAEMRAAGTRIYDVYRNGFAHEYGAKGACEVVLPGSADCGLAKERDVYKFYVETYYDDFMTAAKSLPQELKVNPRMPS